tara:strand:- start:4006 stop:4308 length:303 start_codon:yes stop_codon:yes gene_type:complete
MVQIEWLKEAKEDLKEIFEYVALDSKRYAQLQIEKIVSGTKVLKNPHFIRSGKLVRELEREDVRELVEGHYRIIYKIIDADLVHILLIHHNARDLTKRKI